jgi:hypothetical protein
MSDSNEDDALHAVWREREEVIYPSLFGRPSRGILTLSPEIFTMTYGQDEVDPRWLHCGVLEYAPTEKRPNWLYVTSGFSNPWDMEPSEYASSEYSGFGSELVMQAPAQADWAVACLQRLLAYDFLLAYGRFGEPDALYYGARVPLGGPLNGDAKCAIRFVAIAQPQHYPASFQLPSGAVDFMHVVGCTEAERDFAKKSSTDELMERLKATGYFPVTDPMRASTV